VFGETHHATRTPLGSLAIAKNYLGLIVDRRFVVPAATVSLIMGGCSRCFRPHRAFLIERCSFRRFNSACSSRHCHDRVASACWRRNWRRATGSTADPRGLVVAAIGGLAMLLVACTARNSAVSRRHERFLLGMGIVNPLGTAQALSPFGAKSRRRRRWSGFWQMMNAAIGVCSRDDLTSGAVRARRGADGVFIRGRRALHAAPPEPTRSRGSARICRRRPRRRNIRIERIEILRAADAAQRKRPVDTR